MTQIECTISPVDLLLIVRTRKVVYIRLRQVGVIMVSRNT